MIEFLANALACVALAGLSLVAASFALWIVAEIVCKIRGLFDE